MNLIRTKKTLLTMTRTPTSLTSFDYKHNGSRNWALFYSRTLSAPRNLVSKPPFRHLFHSLCLDLRKSTFHWCGRNTSWRKIIWLSGWEKQIGKDTFPCESPWKLRPTSLKIQLHLLRVQPSPDPCSDPIPRFMTQPLVRVSRSRRSTPRLTHRFNRAMQKGNENLYGYRRHQ